MTCTHKTVSFEKHPINKDTHLTHHYRGAERMLTYVPIGS